MPTFMTTPSGQLINVFSLGGAKALDGGLLLLGIGTGAEPPILDYILCPPAVALRWRDELADALNAHSHRPNRPLRRLDWLGLAASADRDWAIANGWSDEGATANAGSETEAAPQPTRRRGGGGGETPSV